MKYLHKAGRRAVSLILAVLLTLVPVGAASADVETTNFKTINEFIDFYGKKDISFLDDIENTASFVLDMTYQAALFSFSKNDYSDFEEDESEETGLFYATDKKDMFGCKSMIGLTPYSREYEQSYFYKKANISISLYGEDYKEECRILKALARVMCILEMNGGVSIIFLNGDSVSASELLKCFGTRKEIDSLSYTFSSGPQFYMLTYFGAESSLGVGFDCSYDYTDKG